MTAVPPAIADANSLILQTADKLVRRLRRIYKMFPDTIWYGVTKRDGKLISDRPTDFEHDYTKYDRLGLEAETRHEMVLELLKTGCVKQAEKAGKRFLDAHRSWIKRFNDQDLSCVESESRQFLIELPDFIKATDESNISSNLTNLGSDRAAKNTLKVDLENRRCSW